MDTPADPATPLMEVYQAFCADLDVEGTKQTTIDRCRYNIVRFEKWLVDNGHPAILAWLERSILFADRQYLETLPQQPRGSIRRRRGGLMSRHTVHSYLRSIKCLASWLKGAGHLDANPFLAVNPYFKKKGVMPVLQADDRIPKIGKPSDVELLLAGCAGNRPEDLRDRAMVYLIYSSGIRADDAAQLTIRGIPPSTASGGPSRPRSRSRR
jgi:site-specific recombinase XerD